MIEKTFLISQLKINLITYDSIRKIVKFQKDDNTTGYLLDYDYIKDYYKMIAIDFSKQQALDDDPKPVQRISFTGNLNRAVGGIIFFIVEEEEEIVLDFSQETVKVF